MLFNLLAQRYERRSTIITSNLAFSEWIKVFGDEKLATALLDHLSHHAHILTCANSSAILSLKVQRRRLRPNPSGLRLAPFQMVEFASRGRSLLGLGFRRKKGVLSNMVMTL